MASIVIDFAALREKLESAEERRLSPAEAQKGRLGWEKEVSQSLANATPLQRLQSDLRQKIYAFGAGALYHVYFHLRWQRQPKPAAFKIIDRHTDILVLYPSSLSLSSTQRQALTILEAQGLQLLVTNGTSAYPPFYLFNDPQAAVNGVNARFASDAASAIMDIRAMIFDSEQLIKDAAKQGMDGAEALEIGHLRLFEYVKKTYARSIANSADALQELKKWETELQLSGIIAASSSSSNSPAQ